MNQFTPVTLDSRSHRLPRQFLNGHVTALPGR
jgi:hypothetical protein